MDFYQFLRIFKDYPEVVHGFSAVSLGTMRTGYNDEAENNLGRFTRILDVEPKKVVRGHQVHGDKIRVVRARERSHIIPETDGLVTKEKGTALMVILADCYPIMFFDPKTKIIAIAHAGWRGTAKNIVRRMVGKLESLGSKPQDLLVGIGPGICVKHYEVGTEVLKAFKNDESAVFKKDHLDLAKTNMNKLLKAGVKNENVEVLGECTFENKDFYSHRRGKTDKRFAGLLALV